MKKTGSWAGTLLVGGVLLAACSPALNWHTTQLKDAPLQALLPCDALTASRPVELGPGLGKVPLSVVGCEVEGATYAVSHYALGEPVQAAEALTLWQQVVLAQLKSADGAATRLNARGDGPWVPKGALNLPQSLRITFEGQGPGGQKVVGHGLWFARLEGRGARLYHAVIYADKAMPAEAELFFSGLQLQ
ncbi:MULTISPECIES: hypothetical protein [Comamonas]|jgi:hypothetical protein|uniref:hypothetical protein n=1 Tax=Comamonas TaxID=283 RepID=UPI0012C31738|nr:MULTISPECIES: hypothetical protein [Comamonas]MDR3066272.1 hypothetical protein [Comamonas sp.]MEB5966622.1 hypothetical protein [Comamonas testosteroni]MPS42824.1 hypothetical protein [Stenotrophomonas sp.]